MLTRSFRSTNFVFILLLALISFNFLTPNAPVKAAIPGLSGGYTQNFDTLGNTGEPNWINEEAGVPTLSGWRIIKSNSSPPTIYRTINTIGNGSIYSWGTTSERALGSITSGSEPLFRYGVELTNNTGSLITSVSIAYRGEQWVIGGSNSAESSLIFDYQVNASGLNTTGWTTVPALEFVSPLVAATPRSFRAPNDGNAAGSFINLSATINVNLQPNASLWLRWTDVDDSGNDHGLGIDDLVVTVNGGTSPSDTPLPPTETPIPEAATDTPTPLAETETPVEPTDTPTSDPNETNTPEVACSAPDRIYELQEGGAKHNPSSSPSSIRTVVGVVTGDFQSSLDGFYIQDEIGDGSPATSDGIFVYDDYDQAPFLLDVTVGQRVIVTGSTVEFKDTNDALSETQIIAQSVTACGSSLVSIPPVTLALPIADLSLYENYEGMLVNIVDALSGPLTVSETFTLARYGEVVVSSGGRLFQPTMYTQPGSDALAAQALNNRRRLVIDDGSSSTPPDGAVPHIPTTETEFRLGFTTPSITGILEYGFNSYRLQPTQPIVWTAANPRPLTVPAGASDLRVASMNLLNFFNGNGAGGGLPTQRGADTAEELTRQKTKTVAALVGLNADIIVLNELENDNPVTEYAAVEELIDGVNAILGMNTYTPIDTGVVGTDEIRVGILYKPVTVQPVGSYAVLNTLPFSDSRPPAAQLFEDNISGERFYVIANHFKSKGCGGATGADRDQGDGQGCYNATRTEMSELLVNWIATDPYFTEDPDVLIMGDLNGYAREDPMTTLETLGFTNLIEFFTPFGDIAYSYTFAGQSGTLDYAFANDSMRTHVVGAADWHINADEPIGRDYNDDVTTSGEFNEYRQPYLHQPNAFRSSDHDPLVVSIRFAEEPSTKTPLTLTSTPLSATMTPDGSTTPAAATATPTATPTSTLIPAIDLIVNGSFELKEPDGKSRLAPWVLKHKTRNKIVCDKTPTIAFEGVCAFRFKGDLSTKAKLMQAVDLTGFSSTAGDTLKFSIAYHLPKPKSKLKVKAVVTYTDPQQLTGMVKQTLGQTAGYQQFTGDIVLTGEPLDEINIKVSHRAPSGKTYVDAIRLEVIAAAAPLSLPELP